MARKRQIKRSGCSNARLQGRQLRSICELRGEALDLLEDATDKFNLSARAYHRVQLVARTIADMTGAEKIGTPHVAEALSLRQLDRK